MYNPSVEGALVEAKSGNKRKASHSLTRLPQRETEMELDRLKSRRLKMQHRRRWPRGHMTSMVCGALCNVSLERSLTLCSKVENFDVVVESLILSVVLECTPDLSRSSFIRSSYNTHLHSIHIVAFLRAIYRFFLRISMTG